jgi:folate-binding protein YgfZ
MWLSRPCSFTSVFRTVIPGLRCRRLSQASDIWKDPTVLRSRTVLRVSGSDAPRLLNNLCTRNILMLSSQEMIYTTFLDPKKLVFDSFLWKNDDGDHFLDVESSLGPLALSHLKKYSLRMKVALEVAPINVVVAPPAMEKSNLALSLSNVCLSVTDPRSDRLGSRIYLEHEHEHLGSINDASSCSMNPSSYHMHRSLLGVADSQDCPPDLVSPLEMNVEFLNGVDFSKGCYLGQELVAKSHFRGVVRKRVVPCFLGRSQAGVQLLQDQLRETGGEIISGVGPAISFTAASHIQHRLMQAAGQATPQIEESDSFLWTAETASLERGGRKVGKLLSCTSQQHSSIGLALIRLEPVFGSGENPPPMLRQPDGSDTKIFPFLLSDHQWGMPSHWWPPAVEASRVQLD